MKTFTIAVLLSALALTSAIRMPFTAARLRHTNINTLATTGDLGTALNSCLLALRKIMPCGDAKIGLPAMAPFTVEQYNFNFSSADYNLQGEINNMELIGMDGFRVLKLQMKDQILSFDIFYPALQVLAEYDFSIWAKLAGFPFSSAANGLVNVKLNGFRMVGSAQVAPSSSGAGLEVSEFKFQYFISNLESNSWDNLADNLFNNFVNQLNGDLAKVVVEETQEIVQNFMTQQYLPVINGWLKNVNMAQLITTINGATALYDAAATC